MGYTIQLTEHAGHDLSNLSEVVAKRITNKLKEIRSSPNPMRFAKSLTGEFKGLYRFRIGDYRILLRKEPSGELIILLVLRIKHRRDVYL
jgi:mRNA interferase RelE/StbE